jgi:hypothetical protein
MKQKIIFGLALFVAVAIVGYFLARPFLTGSAVEATLGGMGFTNITITEKESIADGIALNGISLDNKKLNSIQSITIRNTGDGKTLAINKLALTGDWEQHAMPDINGMNFPIDMTALIGSLRDQGIKYVVLNSAQIDLILPLAGIVHMQAKGQLSINTDGSAKLQAMLWSDQKQVKAQVTVTGEFAPGGKASLDFEVADGRIDLGSILAARVGGWMSFNKTAATTPWAVSSQIDAGSARVYTVQLRGATFSVQGTTEQSAISLQAAGMEDGTSIAMDMKIGTQNKNMVTIMARTTDMRGLINGMLSTSTPGRTDTAAITPGGNMTYHAESDKIYGLFDSGTLSLSDPQGKVWMNSSLRKTESGLDLDIQEAALKNFSNVLGIEKIDTEGLLTGLLNLHGNDRGGVVIEQGLIRSATAGVISLDSKKLSPQIETPNKNALDLLKSFAYDRIEIMVSSAEEGVDSDIKISGRPLLNADQKLTQMNFHFEGEI